MAINGMAKISINGVMLINESNNNESEIAIKIIMASAESRKQIMAQSCHGEINGAIIAVSKYQPWLALQLTANGVIMKACNA
jgi:hypothetical protein